MQDLRGLLARYAHIGVSERHIKSIVVSVLEEEFSIRVIPSHVDIREHRVYVHIPSAARASTCHTRRRAAERRAPCDRFAVRQERFRTAAIYQDRPANGKAARRTAGRGHARSWPNHPRHSASLWATCLTPFRVRRALAPGNASFKPVAGRRGTAFAARRRAPRLLA